ncbi:MAG: protein tyrosine phosphatase [uncultured bacterium]|nr:MAG: protein tyrosine phosphatase [uncultured bacterium]
MAEGIARTLFPKHYQIQSAGVHPGTLNELTVEVTREINIDISGHYSKRLGTISNIQFDLVVVLAKPAWEATSVLKTHKRILWALEDPVAIHGEEEWLKEKIRKVRDTILENIKKLREEP